MGTTDGTARPRSCRGIRGAVVLGRDDAAEELVLELIGEIRQRNEIALDDIASVIFTLTEDLAGCNPAAILRAHGFESVPLLMVREHAEESLARCLRVLVLVNTGLSASEIRHVYLGEAGILRSDLVAAS